MKRLRSSICTTKRQQPACNFAVCHRVCVFRCCQAHCRRMVVSTSPSCSMQLPNQAAVAEYRVSLDHVHPAAARLTVEGCPSMCSCASSWRTIEFLPSSVLQNNARWGLICPGPLPRRPADSRAPLQAHSGGAQQTPGRPLLEAETCGPHQTPPQAPGSWGRQPSVATLALAACMK